MPLHDTVNNTAKDLVAVCKEMPKETCNKENIEDDEDQFDKRWEKLNGIVHDKKDKVQRLNDSLPKYYDSIKDCDEILCEIEEALNEEASFGVDQEEGKQKLAHIEVWPEFRVTDLV